MKLHLAAAALVCAASFAAYSNSLRNGFVWDDHIYVEANPLLREPGGWGRLLAPGFYAGPAGVLCESRPVFLASLLADKALWGLSPRGFHLTSVALHAAAGVLLYALACCLGLPQAAATLAGLIFALHPVQTEAVNAVSFRPDLLAAVFALAALLAYAKAREAQGPRLAALVAASAALFGLGLLSKEMAASLPALALLVEAYFPLRRGRAARLALAGTAFLVVFSAFALFWASRFRYDGLGRPPALRAAMNALAAGSGAAAPHDGASAGRGLVVYPPASSDSEELYRDRGVWFWTMTRVFAEYFRLMIFPDALTADRAPELSRRGTEPAAAGSALVLVVLLAYAVVLRTVQPASAFGAAWCFAALLPVSGVLPLYNPAAERYLYFVAAGAALAGGALLEALARRKPWGSKAAAALAGLLLLAYFARTRARNGDWRSDEALFLGRPPLAEQGSRARFTRGNLLRALGRGPEAAGEYDAAVRRNPKFAEAWLNLGMTLGELGRRDQALACLDKAVAVSPAHSIAVIRFSRGLHFSRAGDKKAAAAEYRAALEARPDFLQAWVNLGALLRDMGRLKEARQSYEKALALGPADAVPYYSYALLLDKTGDKARAREFYRAALKKDPSFEPAAARLGPAVKRPRP